MGRFEVGVTNYADMAATQNADIWYELGMIYATGRDGVTDMVTAHKWFNLAAHRGHARAKFQREELAIEMNSSEIAQAQRAAREWMTRH